MGFGESVARCLRRFATFSGRASRAEYWWFSLFVSLVSLAASLVGSALGAGESSGSFAVIAYLVLLLPSLAAGVRRLHDIDRSGWWLLIGLVPVVGPIALVYFFLQRGTKRPNRFGPNPLTA